MNRRERTKLQYTKSHDTVAAQPPRTKEPTAVEHMHVKIPLKPQEKPAAFPMNFSETLKEEYAIKYLQRLGATPTPDNIATVLKQLPLDDCQITSAWKARGSLADVVMVDLYPKLGYVGVRGSSSTATPLDKPLRSRSLEDDDFEPEYNRVAGGSDPFPTISGYMVGCVCMTFDDMKSRFLLPFKHGSRQEPDVLTMFAMKHEEPVTFVRIPALAEIQTQPTLQLFGRRATQRRIKCIEERVNAPELKPEFTRQMLRSFFMCLPFASLSIRGDQEKDKLLEMLTHDTLVLLVKSCVRYLYLEVFFKLGCLGAADLIKSSTITSYHATAPAEIEALYVVIVRLFSQIKHRMEREDKGIVLYLPLHLLALRVAVETVFRCQYPVSFSVTTPTMQYIIMQMDDQLTKLLDGDLLLSRIGILETTCESSKVMASHPYQIKKRHTKLRDQYYQTSEAIHTIFPNPLPGKCRKMIKCRGGAAIANYPLPAMPTDGECGPLNLLCSADTDAVPRHFVHHASEMEANGRTRTATLPRASLETRLELLHLMERNVKATMEPKPRSRLKWSKADTAR